MKKCNSLKTDSLPNFSVCLYEEKREIAPGYTLLELLITIAILGIITGVAFPVFSTWLPNYRLKNAAVELFLNIKMAKAMAIKSNCSYRVVFEDGSYSIQGIDGKVERIVYFSIYDPNGSIGYGCGKATKNATVSEGPIPSDFISYVSNRATFNSRYMGSAGYVYLANKKGTAYAVGTWSSGNVLLKKWNEDSGSWE